MKSKRTLTLDGLAVLMEKREQLRNALAKVPVMEAPTVLLVQDAFGRGGEVEIPLYMRRRIAKAVLNVMQMELDEVEANLIGSEVVQ